MGDSHEMVVHHIGKVVGGIAVRFDQDHIVQLRIWYLDDAIDFVLEFRRSFGRHILADDERLACLQIGFHFLLGKMQAVLVIHDDLLARDLLF